MGDPLDKGDDLHPGQDGAGQIEISITLLRIAHNLKVLSCLFREFYIYYFLDHG